MYSYYYILTRLVCYLFMYGAVVFVLGCWSCPMTTLGLLSNLVDPQYCLMVTERDSPTAQAPNQNNGLFGSSHGFRFWTVSCWKGASAPCA